MSGMRILIALTYYRPHVSGLSIYAERLARGLARHGHAVTVLTSRFHPSLPARERLDGVDVIRVPVAVKISKGAIMPLFPFYANRLVRRHEVINIHMPQFEASLLALLGRVHRKAVVLTYQCDLRLPSGWFNRVVQWSLGPLNHLAARLAHRIVTTTDDYAQHSDFLRSYQSKVTAIAPLIEMPPPNPDGMRRLADRWGLNGRARIGFAARFAAEKGVEYLLEALPEVLEQIRDVQVVFTGAYKDTVGEDEYLARLSPLLQRYADRLTFLDLLSPEDMASFFSLCDVLAVTSLNSTEAFGMVQVEAMLAGTPVVTSDLPGVREAVRRTGMGEVVPPRDAKALAAALVRVMRQRGDYVRPRAEVARAFDVEQSVGEYEALFARLIAAGHGPDAQRPDGHGQEAA
jgi:glycosyltransferase involved in cell wall biosynthesis